MTSRVRNVSAAILVAVALVAAPLATTAASAAPVATTNTLFFSNEDYTDTEPGQEDDTMMGVLVDAGIAVTAFDGGDGSAAAWIAALAGNGVLVIPESSQVYEPGGTPVMSDEAAAAIRAFLTAGGTLILGASENPELVSYLTGLDYTSVWSHGGGGPWDLQIVNPELPAQVSYSNGTYPIVGFDTWSVELLAGVQPLYANAAGTELAAGVFPVGAGSVVTLSYDWYPGDDVEDIAGRDLWNQVLVRAAVGVAGVAPAAPALANTGVDTTVFVTGALGLLMLGAAALIVARTRRLQQY